MFFLYWQLLFSYCLWWFCRDDREFNAYSFNFVYSFETQIEYVCVFLQIEKMLQSSGKKNHVLGHGALRVPKLLEYILGWAYQKYLKLSLRPRRLLSCPYWCPGVLSRQSRGRIQADLKVGCTQLWQCV